MKHVLLIVFFLTLQNSCNTTNKDNTSALLANQDTPADETLTECPPYVIDPERDAAVGTPDGVVGHPGLPVDIRDKNEALDPYGFGCYGACGPSCKISCFDAPDITRVYKFRYANGKESLKRCVYKRQMCRSNWMCRTHDECYRASDIKQWNKTLDTRLTLTTFGLNQYRRCDVGPAREEAWKLFVPSMYLSLSNQDKLCWARYAQGRVPDETGDCWDRTHAFFAFLKEETAVKPDCKDCETVIDINSTQERKTITTWLPVKNQKGEVLKDHFEELRSRCVQQGLRMPSAEEISKYPQNLFDEVAPSGCLWSQSSDFAITNGRLAWSFNVDNRPGYIVADPAKFQCGAICVDGGKAIGPEAAKQKAVTAGLLKATAIYDSMRTGFGYTRACHRYDSGWSISAEGQTACDENASRYGLVSDSFRTTCYEGISEKCRS